MSDHAPAPTSTAPLTIVSLAGAALCAAAFIASSQLHDETRTKLLLKQAEEQRAHALKTQANKAATMTEQATINLPTEGGPLPGIGPYPKDLVDKMEKARAAKGAKYKPRTKHVASDGRATYTNRLILESSPYLLQHAHNPVNWFPWGEEAFDLARQSGRPVFLSIGYSTCHWCHVMEEESFEDPEIARVLNEHFIAIKVDREERPDVDGVYMAAVQAMTGRGGWPMSVFLTPDRKPFFGGTYFPPRDGVRGASRGFLTLLNILRDEYAKNNEKIVSSSKSLSEQVGKMLAAKSPEDIDDAAVLESAMATYKERFDSEEGGLQVRTKFPSQLPIRLLLRRGDAEDDQRLIEMARLTLDKMAAGGMYDHVGGGFHRYSTDKEWLVPHFEKMLYDNALLTRAYLEAFQVFDDEESLRVARETLAWTEREMLSPEGGFFSATDADSIGPSGHREEGYYFTWTPAELSAELGLDNANLVSKVYGVTPEGNFSEEGRATGRSILHRKGRHEAVAASVKMSPEALRERLDVILPKLRQARSERLPPIRDEKILAAWNGLMISAFAHAAFVTGDAHYRSVATKAGDFILQRMRTDDGQLLRTYKRDANGEGKAKIGAFLDDYAFVISALLDLFELTSDAKWLEEAIALDKILAQKFADPDGGFFMTSSDAEGLFVREKPDYDGAEPAGNSFAALNLLRLGEFTMDAKYQERASALIRAFASGLKRQPTAMSELLLALDFRLEKPREIAIVSAANADVDVETMVAPLRSTFVPRRVLVVATEDELQALTGLVPWLDGKIAQGGRPTAYVCQSYICRLPVKDPKAFAAQLKAK